MEDNSTATSVTILDKEYLINCPRGQEEALHTAAQLLNEKMRHIRASGNVIGVERIAVMAAINISYELLQLQQQGSEDRTTARNMINQMLHRLDSQLMVKSS